MKLRLLLSFISPAFSAFFVLSDLHYDISYNQSYNSTYYCHSQSYEGNDIVPVPTPDVEPFVRVGCDSSWALINETLSKAYAIDPSPDFILITGDLVGHFTSSILDPSNVYNAFFNLGLLKQTFNELTSLLLHYYPSTQIIPMIGNNDAFTDYHIPTGWFKADYLNFLYSVWKPLNGNISPSFLTDGYYSTTTNTGLNILVINSIYCSLNQNAGVQASMQMLWLKNQLALKNNIIITMHISPSIGLYHTGDPNWYDNLTQRFLELIQEYSGKIVAVFAGHFHFGYFQLIGQIPIIISPSISPLFGNNPGFRYFTQNMSDYTEYTFNGYNVTDGWYAESFSSVYGYNLNYTRLYKDMLTGKVSVPNYVQRISGTWFLNSPEIKNIILENLFGSDTYPDEYLQLILICNIQYLLYSDYQDCIANGLFTIKA